MEKIKSMERFLYVWCNSSGCWRGVSSAKAPFIMK
jgi:hypothetical protein